LHDSPIILPGIGLVSVSDLQRFSSRRKASFANHQKMAVADLTLPATDCKRDAALETGTQQSPTVNCRIAGNSAKRQEGVAAAALGKYTVRTLENG
jgi:hypothetical protein